MYFDALRKIVQIFSFRQQLCIQPALGEYEIADYFELRPLKIHTNRLFYKIIFRQLRLMRDVCQHHNFLCVPFYDHKLGCIHTEAIKRNANKIW